MSADPSPTSTSARTRMFFAMFCSAIDMTVERISRALSCAALLRSSTASRPVFAESMKRSKAARACSMPCSAGGTDISRYLEGPVSFAMPLSLILGHSACVMIISSPRSPGNQNDTATGCGARRRPRICRLRLSHMAGYADPAIVDAAPAPLYEVGCNFQRPARRRQRDLAADVTQRASSGRAAVLKRSCVNGPALPSSYLLDPKIAAYAVAPEPAWLWSADGTRVLWANAAGATVFGAATAAALTSRTFESSDRAAQQVARMADTLTHDGAARLERFTGFGSSLLRPLTCICSRVTLGDDPAALLICGVEPLRPPLPLVDRLQRLLVDTPDAVAAFTAAGDLVFATAGARIKLPSPHTVEALGANALAAKAFNEGASAGTIDTGPVTLWRVGRQGETLVMLRFEEPRDAAADGPAPFVEDPPAPVRHGQDPAINISKAVALAKEHGTSVARPPSAAVCMADGYRPAFHAGIGRVPHHRQHSDRAKQQRSVAGVLRGAGHRSDGQRGGRHCDPRHLERHRAVVADPCGRSSHRRTRGAAGLRPPARLHRLSRLRRLPRHRAPRAACAIRARRRRQPAARHGARRAGRNGGNRRP